MLRKSCTPRPDWPEKLETLGFSFHSDGGGYWDVSACYQFSASQIDEIEACAEELHRLSLAAVKYLIEERRCAELGITPVQATLIETSWRADSPSLYGRFDLAYDGFRPPKLLEYNADTTGTLIESALAQTQWLEETGRANQFNSLNKRLIARWKYILNTLPVGTPVHFSCMKYYQEDRDTIDYLRDTANQAGVITHFVYVDDIRWNGSAFVDLAGEEINAWLKFYPWEELMGHSFSAYISKTHGHIFEPAWKALLSNKGILAILWELFPDHPNLLPAYFTPEHLGASYVIKPFCSRQGANITIVDHTQRLETPGPYANEPKVYQARAIIPAFDGRYPVIGAWIVGDTAAGMSIREDATPITSNYTSRFIPHYFV